MSKAELILRQQGLASGSLTLMLNMYAQPEGARLR